MYINSLTVSHVSEGKSTSKKALVTRCGMSVPLGMGESTSAKAPACPLCRRNEKDLKKLKSILSPGRRGPG